jgi:hypothetical protein
MRAVGLAPRQRTMTSSSPMAKRARNIGLEILDGIRQIKRGEHGRTTDVPLTTMRIKLAQHWTDCLLTWPESGMGFQRVDVTMADGRQLQSVVVLNAEWLEVPAEFGDATVVDIRMASTTGG